MPSPVSFEEMHLLINMSLGETSSGEVNFKHLHTLLHEIVNKLEPSGDSADSPEQQTVPTKEGEEEEGAAQVSTPTPQRSVIM